MCWQCQLAAGGGKFFRAAVVWFLVRQKIYIYFNKKTIYKIVSEGSIENVFYFYHHDNVYILL